MVFATYFATKRLASEKVALLAALIAASAPLNLDFTKTSPIDLLFCTFLNIAVLGFAMSVFAGSFRWSCATWAALGLAVITKGPAGIVFFALGTALFLVFEKPPLKTLREWFLAATQAGYRSDHFCRHNCALVFCGLEGDQGTFFACLH